MSFLVYTAMTHHRCRRRSNREKAGRGAGSLNDGFQNSLEGGVGEVSGKTNLE